MKVLHLPGSYPPWRAAGKEVYSHTLATALREFAIDSEVAVTTSGVHPAEVGDYEHEGVPVHVLPPASEYGSRQAFYGRKFSDLPGFNQLLTDVQPDVVHFHDQNDGASLSHLRMVKDRGLPAVLTFHSPGQICPHHDLLRWGTTPCDGELRVRRCTACRMSASGLNPVLGNLIGLVEWPAPDPESTSIASRLLNARKMTRWFRDSVIEFGELSDAVVVLARWCEDIWLRNGLERSKLFLVPSGGRSERPRDPSPKFPERSTLVVGFAGRCESIKGIHVLVDAIQRLPPEFMIEVRLYGGGWDSDYGRALLDRIANDSRFVKPRIVPNDQLGIEFAKLDVAVVPSIWLETGPLTLFDAFAAGTPVIGSNLGGIAERVRHGENGLLFEAGSALDLAACLTRCREESGLVQRLRSGVSSPRTFVDTASDMSVIYRKLAGQSKPTKPS
ncbi:MAG TPA: LPS biosynthesis protein RfbU [Rhodopirellula baltica]|uniref:LPS biosynthesis RfbU related protein n=1 Tax=Rhodopirellula baltica (strain DSM 10527 / NCIMB 13988 / SH1) TaxID=243090 RepID=Q7UVQ7_RHOBA|nr:glycosyltransferase family 4 protein [Rhodopirellula baltica]CAD72665.1 LPS biosynthesis RfbU related protein [Rhodopirellula baltica SH 1]HBE65506.1 LPS biosynthesis protein RfbU [Rhodopirellula baltica]